MPIGDVEWINLDKHLIVCCAGLYYVWLANNIDILTDRPR